jgi:HlyD family secretion protein
MKSVHFIISGLLMTVLFSCKNGASEADATGTFEADEVIVSAEVGGKILSLGIEEGMLLPKDSIVGSVDAHNLNLQKEQVEASVQALQEKTLDVSPQIQLLQKQLSVQQSQLEQLLREQNRVEKLLKADAATGKQLDDLNAQMDQLRKQMQVTQQQINVQKTQVATQNRSILSEANPLRKRADQIQDQVDRSRIINPLTGVVLTKYAAAGEVTNSGKALYKIADLSVMTLRAYITATQLSKMKIGQPVKVLVDNGATDYSTYTGTLTWVSDKAEFTPKTIQTKEERANLVFSAKIRVKNDGKLKIGMYGEIDFE